MSSNIIDAEAGGQPEAPQTDWWVAKWSSWFACAGAYLLAFFGLLGIAFNLITLSIFSAIAGGLQIIAAAIILSIEGSFISFARPIGQYFEGRPVHHKVVVYFGLTILPILLNPSGLAVWTGFFVSLGITALYGMIVIGKKGDLVTNTIQGQQ